MSSLDTSYTLTIQAPGFLSQQAVPLSSIPCSGAGPVNGLKPGPTTCTVTLTQLGRIPLRTWQSGTAALSSVAVSALRQGDPDSAAFAITTGSDGRGLITGSTGHEGLLTGVYDITARKVGYQDVIGTVEIVNNNELRAGTLPLEPDGSLKLTLPVRPVTMRVNMYENNVLTLPAGTITVVGNGVTLTCVLAARNAPNCDPDPNAPPDTGMSVTTGADAHVDFTGLFPAAYTVRFVSGDDRYQPVTTERELTPTATQLPANIFLSLRASTLSGTVVGSTGQLVTGAVVTLRPQGDVAAVAKNINEVPFAPVTTTSTGAFSFSLVKDGPYYVMVDAPGWERSFLPISMTAQSSTTTAAVVRLVRAQRTVTVTLSSTADTAGSPVNLGGATVTFHPTGTPPSGAPPNADLTNYVVSATAPYTVSAPQVPTGTWTLIVTPPGVTAFGPFETASVDVPDPPRADPPTIPNPTAPAVTASRTLAQGKATITVRWPSGGTGVDACAPPTTNPTLPIVLTKPGVTPSVTLNAAVTTAADSSGSATVDVLLPPATGYTWAATVPAGWTGGTGGFDVPAAGTPPVTSSANLIPPEVPVTASLTDQGVGVSSRTITAVRGATTIPKQTNGSGVAAFCLAPGGGNWTFSVRDTAGTPQILLPDKTFAVTLGGPNEVPEFEGFRFQPAVGLQAVPGRVSTAEEPVDLSLTLGAATVWSGRVAIPPASVGPVNGPLLLVGAGTTYSLTGTPTATIFGSAPPATGIDPSVTHATTLTLPYQAVMLTVTASGTATAGVSVALDPAPPGGTTSPQLTNSAGVATFQDIPARSYTVTGTITIGGVVNRGTATTNPAAGASVNVPLTIAVPAG